MRPEEKFTLQMKSFETSVAKAKRISKSLIQEVKETIELIERIQISNLKPIIFVLGLCLFGL